MAEKGSVAFVFPGQGSQYVGMGKGLFEEFPIAKQVFAEAEEALNFPLGRLCFSGPEAELKLTENTQPAILTVSVAALRVLESHTEVRPAVVAGHSLGEYSALVAVGALAFRDAVKVVRERGKLMQAAVPAGTGLMAVILGLSEGDVRSLCADASGGEVVAPANLNGGGQIVIAGAKAAVQRAMELARARGAKRALDLPVSAPFHSPLMLPAAQGLAKVLSDIEVRAFATGVITNVTADVNLDAGRVKSLLTQQAVEPVRWEESVKRMEELGCRRVWEVGPGKVLKGLIRRISANLDVENFEVPQDFSKVAAE